MSSKRPTKRKRGTGPLIVGDIDTAALVTPATITETKKDGTVVTKQIWKSLDTPTGDLPAVDKSTETPGLEYDPVDPVDVFSPPPETTNTNSVSRPLY
jgi:hypothetical protein